MGVEYNRSFQQGRADEGRRASSNRQHHHSAIYEDRKNSRAWIFFPKTLLTAPEQPVQVIFTLY